MTFHNKFEKGDWSFVLKVEATTLIKHINPFLLDVCFVVTHSIQSFIQQQDLQKLGTIELVVIGIYGKSLKSFILIVANGLGPNNTQVFFFFQSSTHNMYVWLKHTTLEDL